jgi:hypothetical protein
MSEKPTLTLPNAPQAQPARVEAEKAQRRRRGDTSENRNLKLHVPEHLKDPNFVYRFVNDKASGRVKNMTENDDWEIVQSLGKNKEVDVKARHVGTVENGQPLKAVLLRKPRNFHEEDKAKAQTAVSEREEALRHGITPDPKGLSGPKAYVPGGSNTIERGR